MKSIRLAALAACVISLVVNSADPAAAQQLYWSQFGAPLVGRVNLDGTGSTTLPLAGRVFGMETLDATRHVYWTDENADAIMRSNADFTGVVPLVTGLGRGSPFNLALDPAADLIFWCNTTANSIGRASLSGGPVLGTFNTGGVYPDDLAVDPINQQLYWTDQSGNVSRSGYDGSNQTALFNLGGVATIGIDLDLTAGKMYVAHTNSNRILRANLDGTGLETLVTLQGAERPFGMELFGGRMYWADLDFGRLRSANLDGSNVTTILSGLSQPRQVSIMAVPEPSAGVLLAIGFSLTVTCRRTYRHRTFGAT